MNSHESITLLYWLKGQARDLQRASAPADKLKLSAAQEAVARKYGFANWHVAVARGKAIRLLNDSEFQLFAGLDQPHRDFLLRERARDTLRHRWPHRTVEQSLTPTWQDALHRRRAVGSAESADDAAKKAMEEWFRAKYKRLLDFAFYNPASEHGFAWPDVAPREKLRAEFDGKYSVDLINEVADGLLDEGPWGEEDYGDDD